MNPIFLIPFASMMLSGLSATQMSHSGCYNYFKDKDHCVTGSIADPCPPKDTPGNHCNSVNTFMYDPQRVLQKQGATSRLGRRYDTTIPTSAVAGGQGICGFYNSTTTSGVCLWSGSNWVDGSNANTSGWLNAAETRNCGKQVWIQLQGQPGTVQYAPLLDGCNFQTTDPAIGCFQVWLTIDLFDKFGPTPEERANFQMNKILSWDFNPNTDNGGSAAPV